MEDGQGVSASTAQAIADEFDAAIYDTVRTNFGPETDVDGNGRVILLLLDIQDGFSGSGGYVAGYFDSTHMYSASTFSNSNEAEMLFLDTYPADVGTTGFHTTVAHEMQHLVNWVNNPSQDLWINEGLSSAAEYLYEGAHQSDRISFFKNDPYDSIRYGNNFFVWYGFWELQDIDSLANYATVYLFFQWLRIQADNDAGIYQAIFSSPYSDYRSVVNAAAAHIDASLTTWDAVLASWLRANFLHQASGLYSYYNEIDLDPPRWTAPNESWLLSPGEAIYVDASVPFSDDGLSDPDVRFNGIDPATQTVVDNTGGNNEYGSGIILIYNSNSNNAGADSTAKIPAAVDSAPVLRSSIESGMPASYPVDAHVPAGGRDGAPVAPGRAAEKPFPETSK